MIRPHLILQILYIASFRKYIRISPECVNSPSNISISGSSHRIPPRIYLQHIWIFLSPDIVPTCYHARIEPSSLHRMESDFSIIRIRTSQIDRMMSTIDISTPEHAMTKLSERIGILSKFLIKYKLSLPCIFRFSSIGKIDSKYIKNISSRFICKNCVSYSPFIGCRISRKT